MPITRPNAAAIFIQGDAARSLLTIGVLASIPLVLALASFLAFRRAVGALSDPIPLAQLVATAFVMAIWAALTTIVLAIAASDRRRARFRTQYQVIGYTPWVALILIAMACSYPGRRFADWLAWSAAIGFAWLGPRLMTTRKSVAPARRSSPAMGAASGGEQLLQHLSRVRMSDSSEAIRSTLIAEFAPGQRTATLYVAFCPPFERLPTVEAEITDADGATVKLTQVLHNGAQLEVRLPRQATAATLVAVELFAAESAATS